MNLLLDLLFPKRCVCCRKFGTFLCTDCIGKLEKLPIYNINQSYLDGIVSAYSYNLQMKKIIHRFKYRPYITSLVPILSNLLEKVLKDNRGFVNFLKKSPVLIPIPLHFWRKHIRGYNQTELLVKELSKNLKLPWKDILIRTKYTKPQSELDYKSRQKNVSDIFEINPKISLLPKYVVLVDDVWTSGATLKSASRELKRKGVKEIWALTLAR